MNLIDNIPFRSDEEKNIYLSMVAEQYNISLEEAVNHPIWSWLEQIARLNYVDEAKKQLDNLGKICK